MATGRQTVRVERNFGQEPQDVAILDVVLAGHQHAQLGPGVAYRPDGAQRLQVPSQHMAAAARQTLDHIAECSRTLRRVHATLPLLHVLPNGHPDLPEHVGGHQRRHVPLPGTQGGQSGGDRRGQQEERDRHQLGHRSATSVALRVGLAQKDRRIFRQIRESPRQRHSLQERQNGRNALPLVVQRLGPLLPSTRHRNG